MAYKGKYKGKEIDDAIDKVAELNMTIVETNEEVEEPQLDYITKADLDSAIAQAITTTLNTAV